MLRSMPWTYWMDWIQAASEGFSEREESPPQVPVTVIVRSPSSKVAVTMVSANDPRGRYSIPLWAAYCRRHNYDLILCGEHAFDKSTLHPAWWKIPLCHTVMQMHYDYVLQVDADTLPLHVDVPASSVLGRFPPDVAVWLSREPPSTPSRYPEFGALNSGVFALRCKHPYAGEFLRRVWAARHPTANHPLWEQVAIENVLRNLYKQERRRTERHLALVAYGTLQTFGMPVDDCTDLIQTGTCKNAALVFHFVRGVHGDGWEPLVQGVMRQRGITLQTGA